MEDDEQVVLVLVDLRPLVAGDDVLVVERMKLEVLLEPGAIEGARTLDVDPAQAVVLDDLDVGLSWSGCGGVRIDPTAGSAAKAWLRKVRHCV